MVETENFIKSCTTDIWAEIYQKRKHSSNKSLHDWYDAAAQVNQHYISLDAQDNVIKELFRQLVEYICEVNW